LDLFEFSPDLVTLERACAAKVVRRHIRQSAPGRSLLDHTPNDFRAEAVRRYSTGFIHGAENSSFGHASLRQPNSDGIGHPVGYWNCSIVTTLPDHVSECSVFFPLLQVLDLGGSQLGPPQAAPKEDGNHGVVSLPAE